MSGRTLRIVVYDAAEGGVLEASWWTGSRLLSGADVQIGAKSWAEACTRIESAIRRHPGRPVDLQVWSHGYQGAPLIAGGGPSLRRLADALEAAPRAGSSVWFRACDVAEGRAGHRFMEEAVAILDLPIYAHCAVISGGAAWYAPWTWGRVLRQDEICCLTPEDLADGGVWWSLTGSELPSCSALRMTPPAFAHRPHP